MPRRQLVELEDLPWFPATWRDAGTSYLEWVMRVTGHAADFRPTLHRALELSGEKRILDLCSGGGGPVLEIARSLAAGGFPVEVCLTDLHPNLSAFAAAAAAAPGSITYSPTPVDAGNVPPDLPGLRLLCNSFHHLPPPVARAVLADAVADRRPIAVFEVVSRDPLMLLGIPLVPLTFAVTQPFRRPWRWSWAFWTWVVPVLPAFVGWDGLVSCFRVYDLDELRALVAGVPGADTYQWDLGHIPFRRTPTRGTFLVGIPRGGGLPESQEPDAHQ